MWWEGRLVEASIRNVCDIVTCIGFNWWRLETRAWDEFGALKRSQVVFVPELQIRYTVYVNNEVAGKTNCWVVTKKSSATTHWTISQSNCTFKVKSTGATRAVKVISKDQYLWWRMATDPTNPPPFWAPRQSQHPNRAVFPCLLGTTTEQFVFNNETRQPRVDWWTAVFFVEKILLPFFFWNDETTMRCIILEVLMWSNQHDGMVGCVCPHPGTWNHKPWMDPDG